MWSSLLEDHFRGSSDPLSFDRYLEPPNRVPPTYIIDVTATKCSKRPWVYLANAITGRNYDIKNLPYRIVFYGHGACQH